MNMIESATLVLVVVTLGLLVFALHKIRRIHEQGFELLTHAKATRAEAEALFSQLQCWRLLEAQLQLAAGLPPMRGWAGSPDFLLFLAQDVAETRPMVMAECSSGVSTLVLARSAQLNGTGHVYSLEHDEEYARKTRDLLQVHGLADWATVIHAPLTQYDEGYRWYDLNALPTELTNIQLLVVDGPPQATGSLARYPALPKLLPRLASSFRIYVDDANRPDEQEMVNRWRAEMPSLEKETRPAEKGLTIVYRR